MTRKRSAIFSKSPKESLRGLGKALLLVPLLLASCTEILYVGIEQMVPPEMLPEHAVSSVGVVSNFSQHNVMVVNEDVIIQPCDAEAVKECVAQTFADAGFMHRVVVLDSLLYHPDSTESHILTQAEVNALCHELEVEMIYSIDYACLIYNPTSHFTSRPLNAYLCSRIYTPNGDSIQGFSVMDKETIDYWVDNTDEIESLLPEIPSLLAQAAIAPYLPSWKERERVFYYDRLSYAMREAHVYVKEDNWEAAAEQWRTLTESPYRPYRYMGHYNLALYHEMTDRIDLALRSLDMAETLATKHDKRGHETGIVIDTALLNKYREVLQNRQKELDKLEELKKRQATPRH